MLTNIYVNFISKKKILLLFNKYTLENLLLHNYYKNFKNNIKY